MRYPCLLLACCCALALCGLACRPPSSESGGSYIRVEPSRPQDDPERRKPAAGPVTSAEMGIPFYPGATISQSALVRDADGITGGMTLTTRDAYADVVQFYRQECAPLQARFRDLSGADGRRGALNWQGRDGNFTVLIKQDAATHQTIINLVRTSGSPGKTPSPRR